MSPLDRALRALCGWILMAGLVAVFVVDVLVHL